MDNKPDIGKAICASLEKVRVLLSGVQVSGMENHAALVNADNALFAVLDELRSGRVVVAFKEVTEEKGDETD